MAEALTKGEEGCGSDEVLPKGGMLAARRLPSSSTTPSYGPASGRD
jgi:hypothetical protein